MIISIHIPKTGGTTFKQYLSTVFPESILFDYGWNSPDVCKMYELCFPNISKIGDRVFFRIREISDGIINLKSLLDTKGIRVIHGHFQIRKYYGIFPGATYVVWLRGPTERALSHYFF